MIVEVRNSMRRRSRGMAALVGGRGRSANAPCGTGWFVRCVAIRCNNLYLLLNNKDYGMSHSLPSDYLIHVVSGCLACTTVVQAGQPQQTCTSSVSGTLNWPVQNVLQIISTHSFDSSPPHPFVSSSVAGQGVPRQESYWNCFSSF